MNNKPCETLAVDLFENDFYTFFGNDPVTIYFKECRKYAEKQDRQNFDLSWSKLLSAKDNFWRKKVTYSKEMRLNSEQLIQEANTLMEKLFDENNPTPTRVFIVHGRDTSMRDHIKSFFLEVGFKPIILNQETNDGKTVIEKFEKYADTAAFAAILLSPDDEGGLLGQNSLRPRARQNVILELGFFIGKLGRSKVLLFRPQSSDFETPSDISGYCFIPYDKDKKWKIIAAREISNLGYNINIKDVVLD